MNSLREGTIQPDGGSLIWKNKAGVSWRPKPRLKFQPSEAWPQTNERCSEASHPIPQMPGPIQERKLLLEQRGRVCPRLFPSLTLHSSTQESVNPEGIPYFSPGFLNPGYPTLPLIPTPSAVAYRRSNERRYSAPGLPRYATRSGLIQIGGDSLPRVRKPLYVLFVESGYALNSGKSHHHLVKKVRDRR